MILFKNGLGFLLLAEVIYFCFLSFLSPLIVLGYKIISIFVG